MSVDPRDVLAVVIGRAGSRGLPGKNALPLDGRPMIAHTIDAALDALCVGRVIVSTDGATIAGAARAMGVTVIDRPPGLAGDDATVDAAVRHAVEADGADETTIVILYANVPVRPPDLVDRAVRALDESGADSVQSYAPVGKCHPAWMVRLDDEDRVAPYADAGIYRRQDLPPLFLPDGGVIAVRRAALFTVDPRRPHAFLGADRRGIRTAPGEVVDVDTPVDLLVAAGTLRRAEACP